MPSSNPKFRAMHYQAEVLYETTYAAYCNHPTASRMTTDKTAVTCIKCKKLLGIL